MNKYLNELMKMINKANRIKRENDKCEYIYQTLSFASFIYYSGYISEYEFNSALNKLVAGPWELEYCKEKSLAAYNLIANNNLLNDFYRRTLLLYCQYKIKRVDKIGRELDISKYFVDFLKYMNCYQIYQELENKKLISYSDKVLDHSICLDNRKDSYIVIVENDDLYRYITLTHEIAHAYTKRILNNKNKYFDATYDSEIISLTFERIFFEYLLGNNLLSEEEIKILKNNFEANSFAFLKWTFLITEAIKHNDFTIKDYDISFMFNNKKITRNLTDQNYSLGSIISIYLLNKWRKSDQLFIRDLPNIIFYLDKMNLDELLDVFKNQNTLENELNKIFVKKY